MLVTPICDLKISDISHGIDIVFASGIMGYRTSYHLQFYVMSKPFLIGQDKFFLLKTLHGVIQMKKLTDTLERIGVTEDEISAENEKTLKDCFKQDSANFVFNQSDLQIYLSDDPNLIQVKQHNEISKLLDLQKFTLEHSIELNKKDLNHSAKIFRNYFNTIQHDLVNGTLPEYEAIKAKLIGLTV